MALLILAVKTKVEWINSVAKTPIIGGFFLFLLMFIPAVLLSFSVQATIPGLHDEIGFTKAMLVLLPTWNIVLWFLEVRLFLFFLPAWILLCTIALIKGILMLTGNDS